VHLLHCPQSPQELLRDIQEGGCLHAREHRVNVQEVNVQRVEIGRAHV
jgi:hypothetical protein